MTNHPFSTYLTTLNIRQTEYRRSVFFAGGNFLFAIVATIGFGMLTGWSWPYMYGMIGIDILLIVNFLMSWVRLEITNRNIELIEHLQINDGSSEV